MVRPWNESSSARMRVRDAVAAVQPGELERRLDGLGAGVAEEHPAGRAGAGEALQPFGQFDLGAGGEVVAHVHE